MQHIVVVGSLNMDFVVAVERLPAPGETVLGRDFRMIPGGKGANQACAAGRLGGGLVAVRMVGRVGRDVFAEELKSSLSAAGVDVTAVGAMSITLFASIDGTDTNEIPLTTFSVHACRRTAVPAPVLRTVVRCAHGRSRCWSSW